MGPKSSASCKPIRNPTLGAIVWLKVYRYPHWPGKIVERPSDVNVQGNESPTAVVVKFYAYDNDYHYAEPSVLYDFNECKSRYSRLPSRNAAKFKKALEEAEKDSSSRSTQDRSRSSSPTNTTSNDSFTEPPPSQNAQTNSDQARGEDLQTRNNDPELSFGKPESPAKIMDFEELDGRTSKSKSSIPNQDENTQDDSQDDRNSSENDDDGSFMDYTAYIDPRVALPPPSFGRGGPKEGYFDDVPELSYQKDKLRSHCYLVIGKCLDARIITNILKTTHFFKVLTIKSFTMSVKEIQSNIESSHVIFACGLPAIEMVDSVLRTMNYFACRKLFIAISPTQSTFIDLLQSDVKSRGGRFLAAAFFDKFRKPIYPSMHIAGEDSEFFDKCKNLLFLLSSDCLHYGFKADLALKMVDHLDQTCQKLIEIILPKVQEIVDDDKSPWKPSDFISALEHAPLCRMLADRLKPESTQ